MILEFLAVLGVSFILKQGRIFNEVRSFLISKIPIFKDFFDCLMCISFWSGLFVALLINKPWSDIILFSFASSFLGLVVSTIFIFLENIFLRYFKK